jgi:FkbM family methyltransferase
MVVTKWNHAADHLLPSIKGFTALLLKSPGFALRLLGARMSYFSTGSMKPLPTPERYVIESPSALLSYWGFFVERECTAPEWVQTLQSADKPVVVDVGANVGIFSHYLWTFNRNAKFILFEPMPLLVKKINKWGSMTGADMTLHKAAVSDHSGLATFYATSGEGDTAGSLDPAGDRNVKIETPLVTLDSVLTVPAILILKIDVEGFEPDVLRGATETLRRTRFLIMEAHGAEALEKLETILGPEWTTIQVGVADYFFIRKSDPLLGQK